MATFIQVDQQQSHPLTAVIAEQISYRYAFDRSADSIKAGEPGQDYLIFFIDHQRLAFALCDGVSQSFYGDLAAKILGAGLVHWFLEQGQNITAHPSQFATHLGAYLAHLCESAQAQVANFSLPTGLAPMLYGVLEKKRSLGSQATFTTGYIDLQEQQVFLAWMGDSRLRLWSDQDECTADLLGLDTFQTRERWSTHQGCIGELHTAQIPLNSLSRLVTYSDGLARLDRRIGLNSPANSTLTQLIADCQLLPSSDDISYLELCLDARPNWDHPRPKPPSQVKVSLDPETKEIKASWRPVRRSSSYEVALTSPLGWRIFSTPQTTWSEKLNNLPSQISSLSVRSWRQADASPWSKPQPVQLPDQGLPASRPIATPAPPSPTHPPEPRQVDPTPAFLPAQNAHLQSTPPPKSIKPALILAAIILIFGAVAVIWINSKGSASQTAGNEQTNLTTEIESPDVSIAVTDMPEGTPDNPDSGNILTRFWAWLTGLFDPPQPDPDTTEDDVDEINFEIHSFPSAAS